MPKFEVELKSAGSEATMTMKGHFDEYANLPQLDLSSTKTLIVDAEKVESINSVGVRTWIKWINEYSPKLPMVYVKVPKIVVDQMNMVASLLKPGIRIDSFFVPYFCENCSNSFSHLYTRGKEFVDDKINAPQVLKCDKCGSDADIDVIEKTYYRFLKPRS